MGNSQEDKEFNLYFTDSTKYGENETAGIVVSREHYSKEEVLLKIKELFDEDLIYLSYAGFDPPESIEDLEETFAERVPAEKTSEFYNKGDMVWIIGSGQRKLWRYIPEGLK